MPEHDVTQEHLTRQQAARFLGFAVVTMDIWRAQGKGPRWIKIGRAVRFARADLEAWLEAHKVGGEGAA